jgi:hypothetical protein
MGSVPQLSLIAESIVIDFSTPDEDRQGKELIEYTGDAKDNGLSWTT